MEEFNEFNKFWDKKMYEFAEEGFKIENEIIEKHKEDLIKFEEELEKSIPIKYRENSEILNLRKIEGALVKQREYFFEYIYIIYDF